MAANLEHKYCEVCKSTTLFVHYMCSECLDRDIANNTLEEFKQRLCKEKGLEPNKVNTHKIIRFMGGLIKSYEIQNEIRIKGKDQVLEEFRNSRKDKIFKK